MEEEANVLNFKVLGILREFQAGPWLSTREGACPLFGTKTARSKSHRHGQRGYPAPTARGGFFAQRLGWMSDRDVSGWHDTRVPSPAALPPAVWSY